MAIESLEHLGFFEAAEAIYEMTMRAKLDAAAACYQCGPTVVVVSARLEPRHELDRRMAAEVAARADARVGRHIVEFLWRAVGGAELPWRAPGGAG